MTGSGALQAILAGNRGMTPSSTLDNLIVSDCLCKILIQLTYDLFNLGSKTTFVLLFGNGLGRHGTS